VTLVPGKPVAVFVLLTALCLIYIPDIGHGFIKDDFNWIDRSRSTTVGDLRGFFGAPSGFFRPMVSFSFAIDRRMCGLRPLCYGFTNLLLVMACAAGVMTLARGLALPIGSAILSAALWMFNWHGINMATLWISGRTALLLVVFATFAAAAFVRGRWALAAVLTFGAMLAKEEAVLLPVIFAGWAAVDGISRRARPATESLRFLAAGAVVETAYFWLRVRSGAFTAATAPPFYQLRFTVDRVLDNAPAYLDRTVTFSAIALLIFWLVTGATSLSSSQAHRRALVFGLIWWAGGLAVTIFLPVRSSLYACFPSVGIALMSATIVTQAWPSVPLARRGRAALVGIAFPLACWPVYHARNRPSVQEAELSSRALAMLAQIARSHPAGTVVLVKDDRSERPSLEDAFGTLLQQAVDLSVSPAMTVWMVPPPADVALAGLKPPTHVDVTLALRHGALVDVQEIEMPGK
jgi:hypothetical protein